jgi:anti-sigma B factor antagonist
MGTRRPDPAASLIRHKAEVRVIQEEYVPLEITVAVSADGSSSELSVYGEIDIATADQVRNAICDQILSGRHVTVNLNGVSFMDGSGIRALLAANNAARWAGVTMRLAHAESRAVELVLRATKADEVLTIDPGPFDRYR